MGCGVRRKNAGTTGCGRPCRPPQHHWCASGRSPGS
jgi:hypothetical protein